MSEDELLVNLVRVAADITLPPVRVETLVEQSHGLCVDLAKAMRWSKEPGRYVRALEMSTARHSRRLVLLGLRGR